MVTTGATALMPHGLATAATEPEGARLLRLALRRGAVAAGVAGDRRAGEAPSRTLLDRRRPGSASASASRFQMERTIGSLKKE